MPGKNDVERTIPVRLACHDLLLWLAGKIPDDVLATARTLLGTRDEQQLAELVTYAVLALDIPLTPAGHAVLAELTAVHGGDASALEKVRIADQDAAPHFRFTSTPASADPDALERAAVTAAGSVTGAHGLWRTLRTPVDDAAWPPPKHVHVLEVEPDEDLPSVTARVQAALAEAGEPDPQVEVFGVGRELPAYHQMCVAYGGLLWAAAPGEPVAVATIFDEIDPEHGPRFDPGHPRLDEEQARPVLAFLRAGTPLMTGPRLDDVLDETRTASVPMNFRTDGRWIWADAVAYYLEQHGLRPEEALLEHIEAAGYRTPELDAVTVHRALTTLRTPDGEDPPGREGLLTGAGGR